MNAQHQDRPPEGSLTRDLLHLASGCLLGAVAATLVFQVVGTQEEADVRRYREARNFILSSYVEPLEAQEVVDLALSGMVDSLDSYSQYYDRQEIAALSRDTSGVYRGLGVVFAPLDPLGQILFALPNSPADQAGLGVGDRLLLAEGQEVASLEMPDLRSILSTERPEPLQLRIRAPDGSERDVEVLTRELVDPTVRHARMLAGDRGLGYLAITSFSQKTPAEFDDAVEVLQEQGLRGLVLDLRGNLGGVLSSSVEVANRFLSEGLVVSHEGRDESVIFRADPDEASLEGLPLAILVDEESASASEVLAAALQEHRVAVIVGSPTYGKGMVQQVRTLSDNQGVIKLTTAYYYTPSHRNIERTVAEAWDWGLRPDLQVDLSDLEARLVHAHLGTYSPPRASLPALQAWEDSLDVDLLRTHPADAQLDAAVALLEGRRPGAWSLEATDAP